MTCKPFCTYQGATTKCPGHPCSFTLDDIKYDSKGIYISHKARGLGQCADFALLPEVKEQIFQSIPNEQKVKGIVEILS